MSKKILSIVLVAVMLFSFTSIAVHAEETEEAPAPELTLTKTVSVTVQDSYTLTDSALSAFGVEVNINSKNIVALDGATTEYTKTITEISAARSGQSPVIYNEEDPEPFLDLFRFETDDEGNVLSESIAINISVKLDFVHKEVFGDLGYEVVINGFSAAPNLGISLGDAVAVPTAITYEGKFEDFPSLKDLEIVNASSKMIYLDSETVELEGTKLSITTSSGITGTVTYAPQNAHMFTTIPAKNEKIPVNTTEIVTYFSGRHLSTLPISVSHAWSTGFVCITTDKYTDNKPGYHAIVCNGCGEAHSAEEHRPEVVRDDAGNPVLDENGNEIQAWESNEDASFVGNGTASTTCQDCGATLTKDVHGTAGFNTAFANYHFLLVIFEYINLILRIIGTSVG